MCGNTTCSFKSNMATVLINCLHSHPETGLRVSKAWHQPNVYCSDIQQAVPYTPCLKCQKAQPWPMAVQDWCIQDVSHGWAHLVVHQVQKRQIPEGLREEVEEIQVVLGADLTWTTTIQSNACSGMPQGKEVPASVSLVELPSPRLFPYQEFTEIQTPAKP